MPSSLTWFLSRTLVCSTHPPVSVCGTGRRTPTLQRLFSAPPRHAFPPRRRGGPGGNPRPPLPVGGTCTGARRRLHSPAGRRNVRLLSIGYAFRPGLRPRLTLGGRTWPRKPRIYGGRDSHPPFRYSCLHGHPHALHVTSRPRFDARAALSYQCTKVHSAASAARFSPDHFRRGVSRPVRYYAIFKWWLPLSQHPGCHGNLTSLQSTQRTIRGLSRRSGLFPFRPRSLSPAV